MAGIEIEIENGEEKEPKKAKRLTSAKEQQVALGELRALKKKLREQGAKIEKQFKADQKLFDRMRVLKEQLGID